MSQSGNPSADRYKTGHLRITRAHQEISATLAGIDYQYSVIRNYESCLTGQLRLILHSKPSIKAAGGNCEFYVLESKEREGDISLASIEYTGKAYQALLRGPLEKARQAMKLLYGTKEEHLEAQAPKILAKYLKARKEQKTYMQDDLRAVSKNKED